MINWRYNFRVPILRSVNEQRTRYTAKLIGIDRPVSRNSFVARLITRVVKILFVAPRETAAVEFQCVFARICIRSPLRPPTRALHTCARYTCMTYTLIYIHTYIRAWYMWSHSHVADAAASVWERLAQVSAWKRLSGGRLY